MIKFSIFLLNTLIITSGCINNDNGVSNSQSIGVLDSNEYLLVWNDEFEYIGLPDSTKWKYDTEGNQDGWGNNEAQYYTETNEKNAIVENGILKIVARKENYGGKEYTSARLVSKADWKYGKIVVNAKLPEGIGTWPAIWMMPVVGHLMMAIGLILGRSTSWSMLVMTWELFILQHIQKITNGKNTRKKQPLFLFLMLTRNSTRIF